MSNILLKWLEIELSPTVTKRYAISGWPVTYESNTYDNDGTLISTGDLKFVLDLENTPFEVTLSLTDGDVLDAINDLTYRYRDATLYVGMWDSANNQIDAETIKIKNGYVDTHSDPTADHTVTFTISSYINLASQTRTDISASAAHRIKLLDGVFGDSNKNVNDTVFDSVNRDFSQIVLGNVKATSSRIQIGGARPCSRADHWFGNDPIYQTVNTPSSAGVRLENVGELYHTPVAYGKVKVNDQIVNAWNPTESAVTSTYNTVTWNSDTVNANVESSTKYLSIAYVVAHGPVDSVQMYSNHSDRTYNILTSAGADQQLSFIYADDNSSRGAIAAVECTRGEFDQTAIQRAINISNGSWTSNDRGIGYCLVVVTMIASDQWPDGLPEFTFIVDSTKIKAINSGGVAANRTKTNRSGEVIYDFMTSGQYGMDLPASFFDNDSFNEFQTIAPTIYPRRLRGSITGPGSYTRFLERMQQSAAVRIYEEDGKIRLWYGQELDDADIAKEFIEDGTSSSNCVISQRNPRSRTVLNECRGRYFALFDADEELPDNLQKTVIITDTDYLADDNNIKSTATIDLDFLTLDGDADGFVSDADKVLVEQVTNLKLQKSRFFQEVIITTDYNTASGLKLGDLVRCDVSRYGWEGANRRLFIIREIVYGRDGSVELTCQRHSNTVYGGVDSFSNLDIENQFPVRTNNLENIDDYAPTVDGTSQLRITIYRRAADTPDRPIGGLYNFSTSTLTPPAGWHELPPVGDGNLYASVGTAMIEGFEGEDDSITWDSPQLLAADPSTFETVYRFHANPTTDDPGAPTGANGTGGGWVEDTDNPHWEAVTEVEVVGASSRTIEFDINGVAGETPVTKAVDTEQQYTLAFTGTAGENISLVKQQSIVDYALTGIAANTGGSEEQASYTINVKFGNTKDVVDTDTTITFSYDDPDNPGTILDTELTFSVATTEQLFTEFRDYININISGLTAARSGQNVIAAGVSDFEEYLPNDYDDISEQLTSYDSIIRSNSPDFRVYRDSELTDEVTESVDERQQVGNIYFYDFIKSGHDDTEASIISKFNSGDIKWLLAAEEDNVFDHEVGAIIERIDTEGDKFTLKLRMSQDTNVIPGFSSKGFTFQFYKYLYVDPDGSTITRTQGRLLNITYDLAGGRAAPSISGLNNGIFNSLDLVDFQDSDAREVFTIRAGEFNLVGTRTTVTVTDNGNSRTYTTGDTEGPTSVANQVASTINTHFGDDFTALTTGGGTFRVTSDTDTESTLTISITAGANDPSATEDTDNDLAITATTVQEGHNVDSDIGGVDGTVDINFGGILYQTVNVANEDSDAVAQSVADAINADTANRFDATVSGATLTITSNFEGTDTALTVSIAAGSDTNGNAADLAGTLTTVEDGTVNRSLGILTTYTITEGTTQIASGTFGSADSATQMADTLTTAITNNSSNYSASLSGDIITTALDENGSSPDMTIAFGAGKDTDDVDATAAVVKTVITAGGTGTTDLTDAVWQYFVINHEIVVDTDLLTLNAADNMVGVNRGLILDSTAYNAVGTDGTVDLGQHITGSRPPHLVFTGGAGLLGTTDTETEDSVIFCRIEFSTDGGETYSTLANSVTFNFSTTLANFGDFITPVLPVSLSTDADPNTTYTLRARLLTTADEFPSNVSGNFTFNGILFEELRAAS